MENFRIHASNERNFKECLNDLSSRVRSRVLQVNITDVGVGNCSHASGSMEVFPALSLEYGTPPQKAIVCVPAPVPVLMAEATVRGGQVGDCDSREV